MTALDTQLTETLAAMRAAGTLKSYHPLSSGMAPEVTMAGQGRVLVLSSNDYLGLASHPEVVEAGRKALLDYGAGTASVRFICGTLTIHRQLEAKLAALHRMEAALTYVSCWAANTGVIPALSDAQDALISDALNHASLIDGCRLSKAKRLVYAHSNMAELEQRLQEARDARRRFIITDGVFSMEGDIARLPEILALAKRYNAVVLLDDSHGVGVMGEHGRGTPEHFGLEGEVDIVTGTLGKALGGAAGGYIAASQPVIDYVQQVSRPQLFSNALPATVAASALKAVEILESEPQRVQRLHDNTRFMRESMRALGFAPLDGPSAIVPIIVGDTALAIRASSMLLEEGVFVTGFGYPVVPEGHARLRVQISAALTQAQMQKALAAFEKAGKALGLI